MKQKYLLLALPLLILMACSNEEPVVVPQTNEQPMEVNEHRVPLKEALKRADALLSQIGDPATRSKTRKVKSVDYLTNPKTRSLETDTLLYLINYEDNAGFALLAADIRLRPVYAIAEEGTLSFSDTIYNKGLAIFASSVDTDITYTLNNIITNPEPIDTLVPPIRVARKIDPMLNYYQRRWNQTTPYNQYCFTEEGQIAYTGCAAVAVGMIMSYFEYPKSYGGYRFNWESMNNGTNYDGIARFLSLLGDNNNLQMNYRAVGSGYSSGASSSRYYPTFTNMGYVGHTALQPFSEEEICNLLDKSENPTILAKIGPVLVRGNSSSGGHGWVIDGYIQYERYFPQYVGGNNYVSDDILFHCVWGWGGSSNGYFYWATDESLGGSPEKLDDDDDNWNDTGYVYDYNMQYMGNFTPQINPNFPITPGL